MQALLRTQLAQFAQASIQTDLQGNRGDQLRALLRSILETCTAYEADLLRTRQMLAIHRQQLPIALVEWDTDWCMVAANWSAEDLFCMSSQQLVGAYGIHRLVQPEDHDVLAKVLADLTSGGTPAVVRMGAATARGRRIVCEWTFGRSLDKDSGILGYTALVHDITQRLAVERALRVSEERYSLAVNAAREGIWDHDATDGSIWFSPRCYQMLRCSTSDPWTSLERWLAQVHPDDRARARQRLFAHLQGGSSTAGSVVSGAGLASLMQPAAAFDDEWRMLDGHGQIRWIHVRGAAIRDGSGSALRMAGSMGDVTERKLHEGQLHWASQHDSLTGLGNRLFMLDAVQARVSRGVGGDQGHVAILFIDMDRFKDVNDRLGHAVGDQLLAAFGARLAKLAGAADVVARLGGDEFAVMMPAVKDGADAIATTRGLQEQLAQPFDVGGQRLYAVGSIGVATTDICEADADALLRAADIAMYSVKERRAGDVALFEPAMLDSVRARVELINDLRGAIERKELRLVFQPIVAVKNGLPAGFEALLRWRCRGRDVSPETFVPLAESAGIMAELSEWVASRAAQWMASWRDRIGEDFYVSINMSARELELTDIHLRVGGALAREGIDPRRVAIEVTETCMIHAPELSPRLARLRASGHRILLDDFGTGYSSLQNLAQLEFDAIKIDRTFAVKSAEGQSAYIEAISHLAWRLGKQVIIEGVEDERLLARLSRLGVDYVQGYVYSRPLEGVDVCVWTEGRLRAVASKAAAV